MAEIYSSKPKPSQSEQTKKPLSRQILEDIHKDLSGEQKRTFNEFSAFPNITFETQEKSEKIILLLRRHFITNIPWIAISIFMALLPLLFPSFPVISLMPANFQFMTIVIWYMLVLAYLMESFLSWYFNIFIITDERIIDVDFHSLIYKHVTEMKIDRLEDVTYTQGGFLQSMLDYGTVLFQTAAEVPRTEFEMVPEPAKVVKVINQLILQEEQEQFEERIN